jgi:hypothetical protein
LPNEVKRGSNNTECKVPEALVIPNADEIQARYKERSEAGENWFDPLTKEDSCGLHIGFNVVRFILDQSMTGFRNLLLSSAYLASIHCIVNNSPTEFHC